MIMKNLWKRLLSERGEVGDDLDAAAPEGTGTGDNSGTADSFEAAAASAIAEHGQAQENTEPAASTDQTQAQEETFLSGSDLDPRKLPPELQPFFKRMQGVYTKRFQDLASLREKAETVDRFYQDPDFAKETLVGWAAQNGYQLAPINGAPQTQQTAQQGKAAPPPQLIEAFKQNLAPELQWMAEPMAAAMGQSLQQLLSPVLTQQQQVAQQQRVQEYEKYADELRGVAPGWEEHEDVMTDLHDFLRSDQMFHPKYGSKIEMLYNLATAKAAAIKQATDRVNSAAKNRVTSGRSGPRTDNPLNGILQASKQDAWQMAVNAAKSQLNK